MYSTLLFSQVSTTGQLFLYALIFFGMLGFLYWVLLFTFYFYVMLWGVLKGLYNFVVGTLRIS